MSLAENIVSHLLEADEDLDPAEYLRQFKPDLEYQLRREPNVVLVSPTEPGDQMTAPCRVVLHHSLRQDEWVTHVQNMQNRGMNWGHYFNSWEEALRNFKLRCQKYGVDWKQSTVMAEDDL